MKYSVVKIGGLQFLVTEGEEVVVNRIDEKEGETVDFQDVLLVVDDGKVLIGQPIIKGTTVKAKVIKHLSGEKIRVAKFKAKTGYRRVTGFRSQLTLLRIEKIF